MINPPYTTKDFYIVAYEPGAEHPSLPVWANHQPNPAGLADIAPSTVKLEALDQVPGTFQLLNVLSSEECQRLVGLSESLGYLPDASVSLPRSVRHNDNVVWVVDEKTDGLIWKRIENQLNDFAAIFDGKHALGINARFRFYRYGPEDYFKAHTDGAWPGSRVVDGELIANAYPDRYSQMSFLIFLSENFEGGATRFLVDNNDPQRPARGGDPVKEVDIRTRIGGVLCFPHGAHPMHCVHSSEPIIHGKKYIIRTDLLFEI
ncbi:MAG: hypothetical protein WBM41_19790 [Arenicellales bacterium]